jgi:excinuclease ABC subunit C
MQNCQHRKIKEKVRCLSHYPGVYLMKDRLGRIIYVGKAKDLKKRISTYLQPSRRTKIEQPKIATMMDLVYDFDCVEVKSEPEALLLEGQLIKRWKPKYNTDFVDDKRFPLVRVDMNNTLPRFKIVRFKKDDGSVYFGPFPHSGMLRKTLVELQKRYGILLSDASPRKLSDGSWQLYDDARADIYGHSNNLSEEEYKICVEKACTFLQGKSQEWLKSLKTQMKAAAKNQAFEKAAELRDKIYALEKTILKTRKFIRCSDIFSPTTTNAHTILTELQAILSLPTLPNHIECFDISHISGTFCVASMVRFNKGISDKANYRRYKIKSFIGNDDLRAMKEVVSRRYQRLHKGKTPFPDLIVIDGGKGQVMACMHVFREQRLKAPPLIGLAKKDESIIFADKRRPLRLSMNNESLKLLQRIRDEAHRFANTFNADLRSKRIKETILDEIENIGPVRRKALLMHFKTIANLKRASLKELQQVSGIGVKNATQIYKSLIRTSI